MDAMARIAQILAKNGFTGAISERDPEEYAKFKADSYNAEEGNLDAEDGFSCSVCRNKGWIEVAKQDENGKWSQYWRECKCMKTRNAIKRMKRSGLKNIIRDYTFDQFEAVADWQKEIKAAAQDYAKDPVGWFLMGGQVGCGKTHICTAICREFLLSGREVVYMLWRDDVSRLKAVANEPERDDLMQRYKTADVLYIDDLFKTGRAQDGARQKPTVGDINVAFEILNYRYNEKKPTIISSECSVEDLLDIDEAMGSRIYERAKQHSFSIAPDRTKNYRLKGVTVL